MTAFLGIDLDTKGAHCVLLYEDAIPEYRHYEFHGHDAFERLRAIRDAMPAAGYWRDQGVIACAIEEPQGAQRSVVAKLKAVQGGILQTLPRELLVVPLGPTNWRKEVGLSGKATKEEVALHVQEQLGENPYWPFDATDAWCLAKAASLLIETEVASLPAKESLW